VKLIIMLLQVQQTNPQPIAYAYANIHRARSQAKKLDQILRCAEVITRYFCALAIASFAARENATFLPPEGLTTFQGNLAFGYFKRCNDSDSDDLIVMCQGLQKQMLIGCETEVYRLKSHLLDLAREASKGNENNV
jgi:hypothetical protein